jgi:hypothetical protein
MSGKRMIAYDISEKAFELLAQMAKQHNISKTMVIELLIREAAEKGGPPVFREPVHADDRR